MRETSADKTVAMGKIVVSLTLTNWVDKVLSERGFIPEEDIRLSGLFLNCSY